MEKTKFICGILLSFSCAITVCFVSFNLHPRFEYRSETIKRQFAILKGESLILEGKDCYLPPFQNRVIFPLLLKACSRLRVFSVSQWYLIVRTFTAFLSFLIFFYLLVKKGRADCSLAMAGLILLAFELIPTFNHGFEHPTDFFDIIFFSLFIWFSLERKRLLLLVFACLAAANRESSTFAGLIWFFLYGIDDKLRLNKWEVFYSAGVSLLSYCFVLFIRYIFGAGHTGPQQLVIAWPGLVTRFHSFLAKPAPDSWPVLLLAMSIPLLLLIWFKRQFLKLWHKKLLFSAMAIVLISLVFGGIDELRILIPSLVIVIFVVVVLQGQVDIISKQEAR
jgi:hypothetical protein